MLGVVMLWKGYRWRGRYSGVNSAGNLLGGAGSAREGSSGRMKGNRWRQHGNVFCSC